jgi:hypothetical protein
MVKNLSHMNKVMKVNKTTFGRGSLGWWLDEERGKPR